MTILEFNEGKIKILGNTIYEINKYDSLTWLLLEKNQIFKLLKIIDDRQLGETLVQYIDIMQSHAY